MSGVGNRESGIEKTLRTNVCLNFFQSMCIVFFGSPNPEYRYFPISSIPCLLLNEGIDTVTEFADFTGIIEVPNVGFVGFGETVTVFLDGCAEVYEYKDRVTVLEELRRCKVGEFQIGQSLEELGGPFPSPTMLEPRDIRGRSTVFPIDIGREHS